MATTFC